MNEPAAEPGLPMSRPLKSYKNTTGEIDWINQLFTNNNLAIFADLMQVKATKMEHRKMKLRQKQFSVIKTMTEQELDTSTQAIKKSSKDTQIQVTKIALSTGWVAKGYNSFKEYCNAEFIGWEIGYDALNRHRRIGLIIFNVVGIDAVGKYKGDAIMEMAKLEPKQQKHIWKKLQKVFGKKIITRKWLTKTRVEEMAIKLGYAEVSPITKVTPEGKNTERSNASTVDIDAVEIDLSDQGADIAKSDKSTKLSAAVSKKKACIEKYNSGGFDNVQDVDKPEISRVEAVFFRYFKSEFLYDKFFSRRIKNCIKNSFSEKCIVTLCKQLLVELDREQQKRVFTYLTKNS